MAPALKLALNSIIDGRSSHVHSWLLSAQHVAPSTRQPSMPKLFPWAAARTSLKMLDHRWSQLTRALVWISATYTHACKQVHSDGRTSMVADPVIPACGETHSYIPWLRLRLIFVPAWSTIDGRKKSSQNIHIKKKCNEVFFDVGHRTRMPGRWWLICLVPAWSSIDGSCACRNHVHETCWNKKQHGRSELVVHLFFRAAPRAIAHGLRREGGGQPGGSETPRLAMSWGP